LREEKRRRTEIENKGNGKEKEGVGWRERGFRGRNGKIL